MKTWDAVSQGLSIDDGIMEPKKFIALGPCLRSLVGETADFEQHLMELQSSQRVMARNIVWKVKS